MSNVVDEVAMDPKLANAALSGDVDFLTSTIDACKNSQDYSHLSRSVSGDGKQGVGNIFHLAALRNREAFFQEGVKSLPTSLVQVLLSQGSEFRINENVYRNRNPLHVAAENGNIGILHLILTFYEPLITNPASNIGNENPPWLAQDSFGSTPLHLALIKDEECALKILSMDFESLSKMDDSVGNSPLTLAVKNGRNKVAFQILNSTHSYSISGKDGITPLHHVCFSSEDVCRLLVAKHPELVKATTSNDGHIVLHGWAWHGKMWPLEYILQRNDVPLELKSDLISLITSTDSYGENPFHKVAKQQSFEASTILVNVYKEEKERVATTSSSSNNNTEPWLIPDNWGKTPLDCALRNYEECKVPRTTRDLLHSYLGGDEESLFQLIDKECDQACQVICTIQQKYGWGNLPGGCKFLHDAFKYSEKVALWLSQKCPYISFNFESQEIVETLELISANGGAKLLEWLLKSNLSALKEAPTVWIEACKRGHYSTIVAFIDNCPYFRELCLENLDTPLHHIKFEGYDQYQKFLKVPVMSELKNFQNSQGFTPLHQALRNRNIILAEILLTMNDVHRRIADRYNETPMHLLEQACNESQEWDEMCKRICINPRLRVTYLQTSTMNAEGAQRSGTPSAGDMRGTLSVVAALLATLTFAAGFTLPGGFNSDTGMAIMPKKAAFIVFLIADTYAMCCSMLVLFCLIWSMVCDQDRSLVLIDKSVFILMHALYGTLVAFMTGLFTVVSHKSLWLSILIILMCSFVAISAHRSMLYMIIDWLIPSADRNNDQTPLLELGQASTSAATGGDISGNETQPVNMV